MTSPDEAWLLGLPEATMATEPTEDQGKVIPKIGRRQPMPKDIEFDEADERAIVKAWATAVPERRGLLKAGPS